MRIEVLYRRSRGGRAVKQTDFNRMNRMSMASLEGVRNFVCGQRMRRMYSPQSEIGKAVGGGVGADLQERAVAEYSASPPRSRVEAQSCIFRSIPSA